MKKLVILITILISSIFLISFTSALTCWTEAEQGTTIQLIQKCPSCSYSNLTSISYPNGTIFLNEAMEQIGVNFNYTLPDSSQLGTLTYGTIGDKDGIEPPSFQELCIEITPTGRDLSLPGALIYFFLAIILTFLTVAFFYVSSRVNYDKWNNKIQKQYEGKNKVKAVLAGIAFNFAKESFMTMYILFLPVVLLFRELTISVGASSILIIVNSFVVLYSLGLLIVIVLFFGKLQEFIVKMVDLTRDNEWGLSKTE